MGYLRGTENKNPREEYFRVISSSNHRWVEIK